MARSYLTLSYGQFGLKVQRVPRFRVLSFIRCVHQAKPQAQASIISWCSVPLWRILLCCIVAQPWNWNTLKRQKRERRLLIAKSSAVKFSQGSLRWRSSHTAHASRLPPS